MRYSHSILAVALILFSLRCAMPQSASAQDTQAFDKPPEPVGGMSAIMNAVVYPKSAKNEGLEGRVLVSVTIDTAGHSMSVTVKQGVSKALDQSATHALEKIRWIPAQKAGKPVECTVVVPIQFKLEKKPKN